MKEQFIRNAQTQFLRETVAFYHSGNRALIPGGTACVYEPTPHSPGCAIGRHMANKDLCVRLHGSVWALNENGKGEAFGPLLALGIHFLAEVQNLHDTWRYWNGCGLSDFGVDRTTEICKTFGLEVCQVLPTGGVTNR